MHGEEKPLMDIAQVYAEKSIFNALLAESIFWKAMNIKKLVSVLVNVI